MNEQDKKAFEKWYLEYPSWIVTMSCQESCSKAWQAACEYKQKEIDELEKEQVKHIDILKDELNSIIKSLQAENAKLKNIVMLASEANCYTEYEDACSLARQVLKELDNNKQGQTK